MAEPIEMPFGLRTGVGPRNHVLDGGQDHPMGTGNFEGKGTFHCKVQGHSVVICAKTAEPIMMLFGLWAENVPRNHELEGWSRSLHESGQFWGKWSPFGL